MPERLQVQRPVAASAGEIFAVRTDPRGHIAIDGSGMLTEASGNIVTKVAESRHAHGPGRAQRLPLGLYDVTAEIVTFQPDRQIAWTCTASWTSATCTATGWSPSRRARS